MARTGKGGGARGVLGESAGTSFPAKALKVSQLLLPEGKEGRRARGFVLYSYVRNKLEELRSTHQAR